MRATLAGAGSNLPKRRAGYRSHTRDKERTRMSLPALLGGEPVAGADTYPSWPQWGERESEELLATLDSGDSWTGEGESAFAFARGFAEYQGAAGGLPF